MPFTPKAPQFLFENYTRNDKQWFREHKDIYEREVLVPFAEMITYLTPLMNEIDDKIICDPKKVSRIYRDVRLIRDGMFFKKSVWCSLMRKKEPFVSKPEFYFWISPDGFGWGCGYYKIPTDVMQAVRELIVSRDKAAVAAMKAYKKQDRMALGGEMYKRDRFPDEPQEVKEWLNRKNLYLTYESDDGEVYFSEDLPKIVAQDMKSVADVYRLFIKAEELASQA